MNLKIQKLVTGLILIFLICSTYTFFEFSSEEVSGTNVSGTQTGFWNSTGNPYIVTENITVPSHSYLIINEGVTVKFEPNTKLEVNGELKIRGTKINPVTITSNMASPYPGCYEGIIYELTGIGEITYTKISYAKDGVKAFTSHEVAIRRSEMFNCINGTKIYSSSNVTVENCNIHNNTKAGIYARYYSVGLRIRNNTIWGNPIGIRGVLVYVSMISNNSIYKNDCGINLMFSRINLLADNRIYSINSRSGGISQSFSSPSESETELELPPNSGSRSSRQWPDDEDDDDDIDIEEEEEPEFPVDRTNAGIYLNRSSYNTLINNSVKDTTGCAIMLNRSARNEFEGNIIKDSTEIGIYLRSNSPYNIFVNNTIEDVQKSAVALFVYSAGNTFINNSISKLNNQYGFEFDHKSIWNSFTDDNRINNVPVRIYYQVPGNVITNQLKNLVVTEPLMTNLGQLMIVECENFTIQNSQFFNGETGIFFYNSNNGTLYDINVVNNNDYGVYFGYNTTDVKMVNSSVTSSGINDLYIDEFSNITVLNTTFSKSKVTYNAYSNLTIQWFMHVKSVYGLANVIVTNTRVQVLDAFDNLVYNGTSGYDGTARFIVCTELVQNNKHIISFSPYNVSSYKIYYQPGFTPEAGIVMDSSKWVTLKLSDNHNPIMAGPILPVITHNRNPTISWPKGTDPDDDKLSYAFKLWNVNTPTEIIEQNATSKLEFVINTNLTYGERYGVAINASDPYGGLSNDITGSFYLINHAPSAPTILIKPQQDNMKNKPSRNDDLNCTIVVQSSDIDDNPRDEIKYNYLWYKNGVFQEGLSIWNSSKDYHVLPKNYTELFDNWVCEVTATDGFDLSSPVTDSRNILNNPPRSRKYPTLELLEDTIDYGSIKLSEMFADDDHELLTYSYSITGDNISIEIFEDGIVQVIPKADWSGDELVVFSADDGVATTSFTTKIVVLPVNDKPFAQILLPINDSHFLISETIGINFLGVYDDVDIPFGDIINVTWLADSTTVLGYTTEVNQVFLPLGNHSIEFIVHDSKGIVVKDSVFIKIVNYSSDQPLPNIPWVNLTAPLSSLPINTTTVTLAWELVNLNSTAAESVLFDVYLDTADPPRQLLISKYTGTNITLTDLEDNTTYYWWVIPYFKNFQGVCLSGVWNFTIDLVFKFEYGVELIMGEKELIILAGETRTYNFTVINLGNVVDKYHINVEFLNNTDLLNFTTLEYVNITLFSFEFTRINLTISIPENYTLTSINDIIVITAVSTLSHVGADLSRNMTIIGEYTADSTTTEDDEPGKIPPDLFRLLFFIMVFLIIILILIVMFLGVLLSWLKRQEKLDYPVKPKVIVRKQRKTIKTTKSQVILQAKRVEK